MRKTIFSSVARYLLGLLRGGRTAPILGTPPSGVHPPTASVRAQPALSPDLSPFAQWVGELDDEVTEYISGQRLSQVLLKSEKKSAAVKQRQTARRQQEMLTRPAVART